MDPAVISLLGILVGLIFLIVAAFKGFNVLFTTIIGSLIVILFSGINALEGMKTIYLPGFASFAQNYLLLFVLSSVYAKLLGESGAARCIAYKMIGLAYKFPGKEKLMGVLSMVLITAILTYGGISLYVVAFTLVVIGKDLFKKLDIPWSMYTCVSLGSSTFTMSMLPGNPSVQNLVPAKYLGTTVSAAPVVGTICAVLCVALGVGWIMHSISRFENKGEGFLPSGTEISKVEMSDSEEVPQLNLLLCLLPSIALLVVLNPFKQDILVALTVAIILTIVLFYKQLAGKIKPALAAGCGNGVSAISNVCAVNGFGAIISGVAGYNLVLDNLNNVPGPPIIQVIVAVGLISAVTGSAAGGMNIAFTSLGEYFLAAGLSPQIVHRIGVMAGGAMSCMPHNGSIINNMSVPKLYHKYGYKNYFVMTVAIPMICVVVAVLLSQLGLC